MIKICAVIFLLFIISFEAYTRGYEDEYMRAKKERYENATRKSRAKYNTATPNNYKPKSDDSLLTSGTYACDKYKNSYVIIKSIDNKPKEMNFGYVVGGSTRKGKIKDDGYGIELNFYSTGLNYPIIKLSQTLFKFEGNIWYLINADR